MGWWKTLLLSVLCPCVACSSFIFNVLYLICTHYSHNSYLYPFVLYTFNKMKSYYYSCSYEFWLFLFLLGILSKVIPDGGRKPTISWIEDSLITHVAVMYHLWECVWSNYSRGQHERWALSCWWLRSVLPPSYEHSGTQCSVLPSGMVRSHAFLQMVHYCHVCG